MCRYKVAAGCPSREYVEFKTLATNIGMPDVSVKRPCGDGPKATVPLLMQLSRALKLAMT